MGIIINNDETDKKEITIPEFNFGLVVYKDRLELKFINSTHIKVNGDLSLDIDGEFSVITHNDDIHLDSIDHNIHLNSRLANQIKDTPKSIKYREQIEIEQNKNLKAMEKQNLELTDYLMRLEHRINVLEEKCKE